VHAPPPPIEFKEKAFALKKRSNLKLKCALWKNEVS
jgi:hypothetical protein